jgi:hypothetical protein
MVRTQAKEAKMTMITIVQTASRDAYPVLIAGLQAEYGREESVAIAAYFLGSEWAEFHWDSRVAERHLGTYESVDDEESELERVAIMGRLQGTWFIATCLVDGNGAVHELRGLQLMTGERSAEEAFIGLC